jgi:hypothetical protein
MTALQFKAGFCGNLLNACSWPVSAHDPAALTGQALYRRLLSYFKCIINLNAKIANSALKLGMS